VTGSRAGTVVGAAGAAPMSYQAGGSTSVSSGSEVASGRMVE
jgi:hypothetical protein